MNWAELQPYFVLLLLVAVFGTMVSERFRVDVVAMIGVSLLLVTGTLSTNQVLAVFSNEAPITVAAMFVLSAALERTGVVERAGLLLSRYASGSPLIAMFTLTSSAAAVSAFMNNTPVVVILTPVTIALAHSLGLSASKFLIPLSYATVLGGTCSLIGTSTNIVANGAAVQQGMRPFTLFEISSVGIPLTIIGIIYLCTVGLRLLPSRETFSSIMAGSRQRQFLTEVLVPLGSPLIGKTADESGVGKKLNARVIDVIRDRISLAGEMDRVQLEAGDRVVLRTNVGDVIGLRDKSDVVFGATGQHAIEPIATQNTSVMEGIIGPHSRFVGYRLADLNLRRQYSVYILAVHRQGENLHGNFDQVRLAFGDTILLEGPADGLKRLFEQGALVSLSEPTEQPLRRHLGWLAISALVAVLVLATFEVLPISALALIASAVVIVGGCLDADEAYSSLRWPMLMLIFGSLALGKAMETSGAAQLVVDGVMHLVTGMSPYIILSIVYLLTMILTEFLSNNATAILLTPIAIGLAHGIGIDPRPFVVAVMLASSNAFATPIGYQTNTFVFNAGGYKFTDFVKIGLPLNIIIWIAASFLIPTFFPLY
ncbi:MAG: SLC13 family permease [Geminicoccaceae bacterium]